MFDNSIYALKTLMIVSWPLLSRNIQYCFVFFVHVFPKVLRSSVWDKLGLRWNDDVDTLGQTFGEDVR